MLHSFKILTVTHKRVNLKRLAHFVIRDPIEESLKALKENMELSELMYLATCNRVMYLFVDDRQIDDLFVSRFFDQVNPDLGISDVNTLLEEVSILEGMEAISHLYEVASSMDSLVVGEREILRQLRQAYEQCNDWGLTGHWIQVAFQHTQLAAKQVYSNTRIGEKPVSVVSLAMQQMLRHNLQKDARILLVGAGQTNSLVAKFLVKHGFSDVTVFNRTIKRAEQLATFLEGRALPLKELSNFSAGFDCLIVCTGSRKPIITPEVYANLLAGESGHKVVIDLSIPHNVSTEVVESFPVHYVEIEGLRQMAKENLAFREQEVQVARKHLQELLQDFPIHLRQRKMELAMREVPVQIKSVRNKAVNEVFRKEMDELDQPTRELIDRMMEYMEKKCIGIPMRIARTAVLSDS